MRLWLALLVAALAVAPARAAEQRVTFPAGATRLVGYLTTPAGRGPHPAVVLIHSCLGLPSNRAAIGARIAEAGMVALFVDEFSARGLAETCARDFPEGPGDAEAALAWLTKRRDVDAARTAVVGFSQGGAVALTEAVRGGFEAAAALYPPCADIAGERLASPTLILIGAADPVTPAKDCAELAKANLATARLIVYPGAGHVFDDPQFAGGVRRLGMLLTYDGDAAARAYGELIGFLKARLR